MDEREPTRDVIPLLQQHTPALHIGIYLNLNKRKGDWTVFSLRCTQCKLGEDLNMADYLQNPEGVGSFYFGVCRRVKIFFN